MKLLLTAAPIALLLAYIFADNPTVKDDRSRFVKLSRPERLRFNAELEYMKTRDPKTGKIPIGIESKQIDFVRGSIESQMKNESALYQDIVWKFVGPNTVQGRMKAVRFDAADETALVAGAASGGLWRSDDAGKNWIKTTAPDQFNIISCLAQDVRAERTDVWYAGTGEALSTTDRRVKDYPRTVGLGSGIFKSTDGARTWTLLESTDPGKSTELGEPFQMVWNIKINYVDPENPTIYAACLGAIMKSDDSGESWSVDLDDAGFRTDVEIAADGTVFAASSGVDELVELVPSRGVRVLRDGSWTDISPEDFDENCKSVVIASAPSNASVLYLLTETPIGANQDLDFAKSQHRLYKLTYDAVTGDYSWENRTSFLPGGGKSDAPRDGYNTLGGYCMTLDVFPTDENKVFVGGTNLYYSPNGFNSEDSWTRIGGYPYYNEPNGLHPDQHSLALKPSDPTVAFIANDGGMYKTNDILTSQKVDWYRYNEGLETTQIYDVSIDRTGFDENLVAGLQDNESHMSLDFELEELWTRVGWGDGMTCFIADGRTFLLVSSYNGTIWSSIVEQNGELVAIIPLRPKELSETEFPFYNVYAVDPSNNDVLYVASKTSIYRKTELKAAALLGEGVADGWSKFDRFEQALGGASPTAIEISPIDSETLLVGTSDGRFYRLENSATGDPTPLDLTSDVFPAGAWVSSISVDPDDPYEIVLAFSNYNIQSVFRSLDGGFNWEPIGGSLEEQPDGSGAGPSIRRVEIAKFGDQKRYFAGTSAGLFSTEEIAGNDTYWRLESPERLGLQQVEAIDSRATDGLVAIGSHGSGAYVGYLSGVSGIREPTERINLSMYPNPATEVVKIEIPDHFLGGKIEVSDVRGEVILSAIAPSENYQINTGSYSSGTYYVSVRRREESAVGRFVVGRF